jgi:hypothetical protein
MGCGTGYLLGTLADRYPDAQQLCGIDAAPQMIATASAFARDDRLSFTVGVAEEIDRQEHVVRSLDRSASGTRRMRPSLAPRRPLGARRPVLGVAAANPAHQPSGQSPHQGPRHQPCPPRGVSFPAMAPDVRHDHQRRDRDQPGSVQGERPKAAVEHLEVTDRATCDRTRVCQHQFHSRPREFIRRGSLHEFRGIVSQAGREDRFRRR